MVKREAVLGHPMGRASCRLDAARHGWRRRDGVRPHHHFQREAVATAFRGLWRRSLCRVGDCFAWRLSRCPVAVLWLPCHPFGRSRGWVGHRVGWMLPGMGGGGGMVSGLITTSSVKQRQRPFLPLPCPLSVVAFLFDKCY